MLTLLEKGGLRPFDRHDWTVDRGGEKIRYIIDFYAKPTHSDPAHVHLDVRPALDSIKACKHRFKRWVNELINVY